MHLCYANGPSLVADEKAAPVKYKMERKLQLLCAHQLHGTITGLAALRTIESSVDGLDRLLVSFKDAKVCFNSCSCAMTVLTVSRWRCWSGQEGMSPRFRYIPTKDAYKCRLGI
jgi:hypothetical protein